MKHILEVCLVAFVLAKGLTSPVAAQTSAAVHQNSSRPEAQVGLVPTLRKGIPVELPSTTNAVVLPKADEEDSLIVTVTSNGEVYLGVDPVGTTALPEKIKRALSYRAEKTLYVKADARTAYANVVAVLDSVRTAGIEGLTLITDQRDGVETGVLVQPKGLEMLVVSRRSMTRKSSESK